MLGAVVLSSAWDIFNAVYPGLCPPDYTVNDIITDTACTQAARVLDEQYPIKTSQSHWIWRVLGDNDMVWQQGKSRPVINNGGARNRYSTCSALNKLLM